MNYLKIYLFAEDFKMMRPAWLIQVNWKCNNPTENRTRDLAPSNSTATNCATAYFLFGFPQNGWVTFWNNRHSFFDEKSSCLTALSETFSCVEIIHTTHLVIFLCTAFSTSHFDLFQQGLTSGDYYICYYSVLIHLTTVFHYIMIQSRWMRCARHEEEAVQVIGEKTRQKETTRNTKT
jgi:hypothetical protein